MIFENELNIYENVITTPEEHARLTEKCDTLVADFKDEYTSLTEKSNAVIEEYFNSTNENYITSKVTSKELINKNALVKTAVAFALGAGLAFVIGVITISISEKRKIKKKKEQIAKIKKDNPKGA